MSYQSIDQLQKVLANKVFHYTQDAKKASGRALGTLVEIITFYLLKSWGFENSIAIEKPLSEYGNPEQNGEIYSKPYTELISDIVNSDDPELLKDFILTVGVVSNHGNWFTSDNHNKELRVLAQSYDWLLFLTDEGLAEFITELLLKPQPLLKPARKAFLASYTAEKKKNAFTKVQMDYEADQVLQSYFVKNLSRIEKWFNIITPQSGTMPKLHSQISQLRDKNWEALHSL